MGEGAARRGLGHRHPRPGLGTRKIHPPRWTLGTDTSSQIGGPLARQYRTAQNIWKKRLRISGTHNYRPSRSYRDAPPTLVGLGRVELPTFPILSGRSTNLGGPG